MYCELTKISEHKMFLYLLIFILRWSTKGDLHLQSLRPSHKSASFVEVKFHSDCQDFSEIQDNVIIWGESPSFPEILIGRAVQDVWVWINTWLSLSVKVQEHQISSLGDVPLLIFLISLFISFIGCCLHCTNFSILVWSPWLNFQSC